MSKNSKLKPLRKIVRDFSSGEFIIVRDFSRMNETKCNRSGFLSRHSRSILNRPCCLERMSHSDVLTYKGIPRRFFVSPLREHRTASLLLPSDFEASFGVCSPCDALTQRMRERERERNPFSFFSSLFPHIPAAAFRRPVTLIHYTTHSTSTPESSPCSIPFYYNFASAHLSLTRAGFHYVNRWKLTDVVIERELSRARSRGTAQDAALLFNFVKRKKKIKIKHDWHVEFDWIDSGATGRRQMWRK